MENTSKVKAVFELYELINFYYENRDRPANFDFFKEVENYCQILDLDITEFKEQFNLTQNL